MIIFGWGRQTIKQIGVAFKKICGHCKNEEHWLLTRTITWFTLFFIPIIPYSVKYFLNCPICSYGFDLDSKQVDEIRPIAELNQMLIDGQVSDEEYREKMRLLNGDLTQEPTRTDFTESTAQQDQFGNAKYCRNCGTIATEKLKFCGNCGIQVEGSRVVPTK